jgi:rubredoxin---NAD+ reductase
VHWYLHRIAQAVQLADGKVNVVMDNERQLQVDVVLSAIGLHANTTLANAAGLHINRGIVVDRKLCSSDPHIYALGDCAEVEGMVLPFVMPLMQQTRALAATLTGTPTDVSYPAMPVLVKTTSYPVIVSPPPYEAQGAWEEEILDGGVKALFKSGQHVLGFALTGAATSERQALMKLLPKVMP